MTESEYKKIVEEIKNHILKYDDKNANFSKWCAGITDKPEEKKIQLESKAKVEFYEKWDLETKHNAIHVRDILLNDMEFQPFVLEKRNEMNITKFSEINNSVEEKLRDDLKYVIVFKNQ